MPGVERHMQNRLLDALPEAECDRLRPHLQIPKKAELVTRKICRVTAPTGLSRLRKNRDIERKETIREP